MHSWREAANWSRRRRWIANAYQQRLKSSPLQLPADSPEAYNVYWLYTVILPQGFTESQRDDLIQHLGKDGIESRPFFYPLPSMPPYRQFARPVPHSESIASRGITLPTFHSLQEEDIERVTSSLLNWLGNQ